MITEHVAAYIAHTQYPTLPYSRADGTPSFYTSRILSPGIKIIILIELNKKRRDCAKDAIQHHRDEEAAYIERSISGEILDDLPPISRVSGRR